VYTSTLDVSEQGPAGVTPVLGWCSVGEKVSTALSAGLHVRLSDILQLPGAFKQTLQGTVEHSRIGLTNTWLTKQLGVFEPLRVFASTNRLNDGLAQSLERTSRHKPGRAVFHGANRIQYNAKAPFNIIDIDHRPGRVARYGAYGRQLAGVVASPINDQPACVVRHSDFPRPESDLH